MAGINTGKVVTGGLLAGLLLNALGFALLPESRGFWSLTGFLIVAGVGNQILRPTNVSLLTKRTTHGQGTSIGILDSFDSLGRVLGPVTGGFLFRLAPPAPYRFCAGVVFVLAIAVLRMRAAGTLAPGGLPLSEDA